jgi:hypothetical protein
VVVVVDHNQTTVSSLCYWYIDDTTNTIQNVSRSKDNNTNERSFLIMATASGSPLNPGLWDACSSTDDQYKNVHNRELSHESVYKRWKCVLERKLNFSFRWFKWSHSMDKNTSALNAS